MICDHVQHHLDSFVRGEMSAEMSRDIEAHIASCAACAAETTLARRIAEGLRAMKQCAPEGLGRRVIADVPVRQSQSRASWIAPSHAIAAALLVSAVLWLTNEGRRRMLEPELAQPAVEIDDHEVGPPALERTGSSEVENIPLPQGAGPKGREPGGGTQGAGLERRDLPASREPVNHPEAPPAATADADKAVAPISVFTRERQSVLRSTTGIEAASAPSMQKEIQTSPEPSPVPPPSASAEARSDRIFAPSARRAGSAPSSRAVAAPAAAGAGAATGNTSDKDGFKLNEVNMDVSSQLSNDISAFAAVDTFCLDTAPPRDTKTK